MRQRIIDLAVQYGFKTVLSDSIRFESVVGYIDIGRYTVGYAIGGIAVAQMRLCRFRVADLKRLEDLILQAQIRAAF